MRASERPATQAGFTLLEVLVALVIIALGLIAVFGQLNQALLATSLLQEKTFAHWIAVDRITELRVNGEFPRVGERRDDLRMAGAEWVYTLKFTDVGIPEFRRVDVSVALSGAPDRELAAVAGFLTRPAGDGGPAQLSGWGSPPAEQAPGALQ